MTKIGIALLWLFSMPLGAQVAEVYALGRLLAGHRQVRTELLLLLLSGPGVGFYEGRHARRGHRLPVSGCLRCADRVYAKLERPFPLEFQHRRRELCRGEAD